VNYTLQKTSIATPRSKICWAFRPSALVTSAFRIHKTDLSLRPIWHQKAGRVQAHILVCFFAYVLWKYLSQLRQRAGLGDEPRRILDGLAQLRVVDVILPTRAGVELRQRCVTQPNGSQKILLERLGWVLPTSLRSTPLSWKNRAGFVGK